MRISEREEGAFELRSAPPPEDVKQRPEGQGNNASTWGCLRPSQMYPAFLDDSQRKKGLRAG